MRYIVTATYSDGFEVSVVDQERQLTKAEAETIKRTASTMKAYKGCKIIIHQHPEYEPKRKH